MNKDKKPWLKPIKPFIAKTIEKEFKDIEKNWNNAIMVEKYTKLQYDAAKQNTKKYSKQYKDQQHLMYGI
jgi:hypothetical protein